MEDLELGVLSFHGKTHYPDPNSADGHPTIKIKLDRFLWLRKLLLLAMIFTISFSMVAALFMSLPKISIQGMGHWNLHADIKDEVILKFPRNVEDLRTVRRALDSYQKHHHRQVQIGISGLYIFLQTFMLPGSIFLNILAGSFYGFFEALLLVTVLASVGSSMCYILSYFVLKDIVYYYFPERCEWLAREVHRHRHNLLNYVLFLRITPLLPNWFINVSSPLVSVPFREFFIGTFIGVIPAGIVAVKAGKILSQIDSLNDLYDTQTLAMLFFLAFLVLLPVLWKRQTDSKQVVIVKTT